MKFPDKLQIHILNMERKSLKIGDIIIFITLLLAPRKNNYNIGPLFSNEAGIVTISSKHLKILAEATLETGIMDYCDYAGCSENVLIEILDFRDIDKLLYGRETWGVDENEAILYESKSKLLQRIKNSNNHLVKPTKANAVFNGQKFLKVELISALTPEKS